MTAPAWMNLWLLVAGGFLYYLSGRVDDLAKYLGFGPGVTAILIVVLMIAGLSMAAIAIYRLSRLS